MLDFVILQEQLAEFYQTTDGFGQLFYCVVGQIQTDQRNAFNTEQGGACWHQMMLGTGS